MSIVVIENQVVHYEVFGRGRPVVFLHGWHGSWRYWFPTMEVVAEYFRTYSFDFWGFGDSSREDTSESIQNYSNQVIRFLDALGIERIILVGHSMGGMVALKTAIKHPQRIDCVVTVGAPVAGDSLCWLLKLADRPLLTKTVAHFRWLRRYLFSHFLGETNDPAVHEVIDDSVKSSPRTLNRAVSSMLRTNLQPDLANMSVPALIVHGGRDNIVNPNQIELFESLPSAEVMLMPTSRHFPFLDEAELFNEVLLRFLMQRGSSTEPKRYTVNGTAQPLNGVPPASLTDEGKMRATA